MNNIFDKKEFEILILHIRWCVITFFLVSLFEQKKIGYKERIAVSDFGYNKLRLQRTKFGGPLGVHSNRFSLYFAF